MGTYSYSRLSTFDNCPLQYRFRYIEKAEPDFPNTIEAFMGSMVHEVLEKLYKDIRFEKKPNIDELIAFYNELWDKNWDDKIHIEKKEYTKENYRQMGERFIQDYFKRYSPFDESRTIGLETTDFVDIGEHKMHVRIDRLAIKDNVYEIHDYKTSNSLPTQDDADNDKQLALYAYGVKSMHPDAASIRLVWHYLAFDTELVSSRTDEQLEELKGYFRNKIAEVEEASDFAAKPSGLCGWCAYRSRCPEFKHLYDTEKLPENEFINEEGVSLLNHYRVLTEKEKDIKEKLEKVKEAILEYCRKKGVDVLYSDDASAAVRNYPRISFPKKNDPHQKQFFRIIKEAGLWDELATCDVYELAKKINSNAVDREVLKKLEPFLTRGTTTRIYMRSR